MKEHLKFQLLADVKKKQIIKKDDVDYIFCFLILKFFHKESIHSAKVFMNG